MWADNGQPGKWLPGSRKRNFKMQRSEMKAAGLESWPKSNNPRQPLPPRARRRLRSGRARIMRRILKETEGGFDGVVDFADNEKSMAFAVAWSPGGKLRSSDGAMGLQVHDHRGPHGRHPRRGQGVDGARPRKIKPTPMKEEPMGMSRWTQASTPPQARSCVKRCVTGN
jgi:hypothetical protein